MKKWLAFLLFCGLASCSPPPEPVQKVAPDFPASEIKWILIEESSADSTRTWILPLENGWLVYHTQNMGGGMAFVPKP